MHDGRGKNRQAYLWQYSHPTGSVVFDFRLGREREETQTVPWEISKGSSKAMAMEPMTGWVDPESSMRVVGRMRGANFLMRLNLIPETRPPLGSWRNWTNFLPLMLKLELRN